MVTNDKFRDYLEKVKDNIMGSTDVSNNLTPSEIANAAYTDAPSKKNTPKKNKKNDNSGNIDFTELKNEEKWIKGHSVSYTFNKDEFLPNPDSKFWQLKNCNYEHYRNYPLDIMWK